MSNQPMEGDIGDSNDNDSNSTISATTTSGVDTPGNSSLTSTNTNRNGSLISISNSNSNESNATDIALLKKSLKIDSNIPNTLQLSSNPQLSSGSFNITNSITDSSATDNVTSTDLISNIGISQPFLSPTDTENTEIIIKSEYNTNPNSPLASTTSIDFINNKFNKTPISKSTNISPTKLQNFNSNLNLKKNIDHKKIHIVSNKNNNQTGNTSNLIIVKSQMDQVLSNQLSNNNSNSNSNSSSYNIHNVLVKNENLTMNVQDSGDGNNDLNDSNDNMTTDYENLNDNDNDNENENENDQDQHININKATDTIIMGLASDDIRLIMPTKMETTEKGSFKRSTFACVRCHSLKQKCLPSDFNDIYRKPCKRCLKTNRLCKFDLSKRTRKRKSKKTSSTDLRIKQTNESQCSTPTSPSHSTSIHPNPPQLQMASHLLSLAPNQKQNDPQIQVSTESQSKAQEQARIQLQVQLQQRQLQQQPSIPTGQSYMPSIYSSNTNLSTSVSNNGLPAAMINPTSNSTSQPLTTPIQQILLPQQLNSPKQSQVPQTTAQHNIQYQLQNQIPLQVQIQNQIPNQLPSQQQQIQYQNQNLIESQTSQTSTISMSQNSSNLPGLQQSLPNIWENVKSTSDENLINYNSTDSNNNITPSNNIDQNDNLKNQSNLISNPITKIINLNLQSASSNITTSPNPSVSSDTLVLPTVNRTSISYIPTASNIMPSMNSTISPGTQHSSSLKKQLQSLLAYQKGKVHDISKKLDSMCKQGNEILENTVYSPEILDPISIGIISVKEAEKRFEIYKNDLSVNGNLPFVKLSSTTTIDSLRRENPVFLSVLLWCTSVVMTTEDTTLNTNMKLGGLVMHLLTHQIFRINEKSINLIQSLLTLGLWYNFPEWSNKTRYHIFNYICCCLTKDLGPTNVNRSFAMFSEEDPLKLGRKYKTPLERHENGARLTLLTYISALNISIFLRQSIQYRWSDLTKGAISALINHKYTNDSNIDLYTQEEDRFLILLSKLNHVLEKIHIYLHQMAKAAEDEDDPEFTERHISNLIGNYKSQLDDIRSQLPDDNYRILSFYYSVEAYLYQYTLADYYKKIKFQTEVSIMPNNVLESFIRCCKCCTLSLESFIKVPIRSVASLPIFHMSRIIYTVGMLLLKLKYLSDTCLHFKHLRNYTNGVLELVNKVSKKLEETSNVYQFNNYLYRLQYVVALFAQTYANKVSATFNKNISDTVTDSTLTTSSTYKRKLKEHDKNRHKIPKSKKQQLQDRHHQKQLPQQLQQDITESNSNTLSSSKINTTDFSSKPYRYNKVIHNSDHNQNPHNQNFNDRFNTVHQSKSLSQLPIDMNGRVSDNNNNNNIINISSYTELSSMTNSVPNFIQNRNLTNPNPNDFNNVLPLYVQSNLSSSMNPSPSTSADNLNEYLTDIDSLVTGFNALNDEFWTDIFINDS
ncbi:hypothetical protein TBLA_0B06240 [Henningerozyma blattae CBS 6284]|uniref:Zn(2)-C6 fungal-type domain-containing protein n=1 Tax=Henningerozyma blattae (strain ATCC 34711 / CBS 6284 / DSM 70876 / NBRC 10599 / NRRL Y-10934 / UCD 77-7) TaxID=1071380 RepID=I2GZ97_HENB6|nr:hypothetical protein TBLA_0B06240 [Tetrapisispora blattae CBS 6284]CCH59449.1 hypothetical protein TBLA_0B06240 [Tetrapisispora blattae CBS 6284]